VSAPFRVALVLAALVLSIPLLTLVDREAGPPREAPAAGAASETRVMEAIDGDTLLLADGRKVRLLGVDAPERETPYYEEARWAAKELVGGREVRLEVSPARPLDGYGRTLAQVFVGGRWVQEELVSRGLAHVSLKDPREMPEEAVKRLVRAQNSAMDRRVGVWSLRDALASPPGEKLVATRYRFHRSTCQSLHSGAGHPSEGTPTTREEALRAGKSPCRSCNPRRRRRASTRVEMAGRRAHHVPREVRAHG